MDIQYIVLLVLAALSVFSLYLYSTVEHNLIESPVVVIFGDKNIYIPLTDDYELSYNELDDAYILIDALDFGIDSGVVITCTITYNSYHDEAWVIEDESHRKLILDEWKG